MAQDLEVLEGGRSGTQASFWHRFNLTKVHVSGSGRIGIIVGSVLLVGVIVAIAVLCVMFDGAEDAAPNTACDGSSRCTNGSCLTVEEDSYRCQCHDGFSLTVDEKACIDADECLNGSVCDNYGRCVNTLGSYECICETGFEENGTSCVDVDECLGTPCGVFPCLNTIGSFICDDNCTQGYHAQPDGSCTECPSAYDRKCGSGECVNALYWCLDGSQCQDGSDEDNCVETCKENQFRCNDSTECYADRRWRDDVIDCVDGSDEPLTNTSGCKSGYSPCNNGQRCIHHTYFCDGIVDCEDQSDENNCATMANTFECASLNVCLPRRYKCDGVHCLEPKLNSPCECLAGQRRCSNGRCVETADWCNGENDCGDNSDEVTCQMNCGDLGHHFCDNTCKLPRQVCDGEINCSDLSDEINCGPCSEKNHFRCSNGACIKSVFRCNGIEDCLDYSDEVGCTYCSEAGGFLCGRTGRCVPGWAVCDEVHDCLHGEDEHNCNNTSRPCYNKFRCQNDRCIERTSVCDGILDCITGEDEQHCIRLLKETEDRNHSMVLVRDRMNWFPLCYDNVTVTTAEEICYQLGQRKLDSFVSGSPTGNTTSWARLATASHGGLQILQHLIYSDHCNTEKAIYIKCQGTTPHDACGITQPQPSMLDIINSRSAPRHHWPWQALLYTPGGGFCGASVIGRHWLVTAAHCVKTQASARSSSGDTGKLSYAVRLGTSRRSDQLDGPLRLVYEIDETIQHPHYSDFSLQNDVAILHTAEPIQYSTDVRPICLPGTEQDYHNLSECYITGWGITNLFGSRPDQLQQARIQVQPVYVCSDYRQQHSPSSPEVVNDAMICLAFDQNLAQFCPGDSGGPLVCRSHIDDTWMVVGIVSWHLPPACHGYSLATNVTSYVTWIRQQTDLS